MNTNVLHLATAYLPLYVLLVGGILILASLYIKKPGIFRYALWILVLGTFLSLFTGGMGGASMSKTLVQHGVDAKSLHVHAWTALLAILLFFFLLYFSNRYLKQFRKGIQDRRSRILVMTFFALVVVLLAWTIQEAHGIR